MAIVARLLWRTHWFEIATIGALIVVLAVAALLAAARLAALTPSAACVPLVEQGYGPAELAACPGFLDYAGLRDLALPLSNLIAILPLVAGMLLGSQLVAGELDRGTLQLAWTLEPTRRYWLVERLVVGGLAVGAVGLVCALVSIELVVAENPGVDIVASFLAYGLWGPLLLVRGLAAFAVGAAAGALASRVVPALLLALLAVAVVVLGAPVIARTYYPTTLSTGSVGADALVVDTGEVGADGQFVSHDAALAEAPAGLTVPDTYTWLDAHFQHATIFIAGVQMPAVATAEGLLLAGGSVIGLGVAFVVVARRRPL